MIKYYGGKKCLGKIIENYLPLTQCETFVDLFVGGGSITDCLCTKFAKTVINDKDENLINFYRCIKNYPFNETLAFFEEQRQKVSFEEIKDFRKRLNSGVILSNLEKAFYYYTCVYCGYGGKPYATPTTDKFNQYKRRNIKKDLTLCKNTLSLCDIYCEDYREIIYTQAFYYADPPYAKVGDNKYYGSNGKNHKEFNHLEFNEFIKDIAKDNCVMISYEDSEFIRDLYKGWNIIPLPKNTINYNPGKKQSETIKTNEVLILSYSPSIILI